MVMVWRYFTVICRCYTVTLTAVEIAVLTISHKQPETAAT